MAKDDYWVVVFQILEYFYCKMRAGEKSEEELHSARVLKVNEPYILDIYRNLLDDGYLTGSKVTGDGRGNEYSVPRMGGGDQGVLTAL
jgi:hypothetical protein